MGTKFWGFPAVWFLNFWFRKVREAYKKKLHLVAPLKTAVVPSYDQKTQKVNEQKSNEYLCERSFSLFLPP